MNYLRYLPLILVMHLSPALFAKPVSVKKVSQSKDRLFVLAIGVNGFEDDFFPNLRWAERDVERIAAGVGVGTGFEVVSQSLIGSSVTKDGVERELRRIAETATGKDALIVYVSTHGSLIVGADGDLKPVFVLPETKAQELASTALPTATLLKWVERVPARRKFVISAACHSGVGKSRLTPEMRERLAQNKGAVSLSSVSEGTVLLSAAARNELAVEDNKLRSDLYTHHFLSALDLFDRNQDGAVSILEAHDYATSATFSASNGRQRPTIQSEMIGDVDIPLKGQKTTQGLPILKGYDQQLSGVEVEVNEQVKGALPFAFALQPGRNTVSLFAQGGREKIATYSLRVRGGQEVSIDKLLAGHPFAAGAYIGLLDPVGSTFQKLIDGPQLTYGFFGRYRQGRFNLGLSASFRDFDSIQVLSGLYAQVMQTVLALRPGLRLFSVGPIGVGGEVLLGYEALTLQIRDKETGFSRKENSQSLLTGAGISFDWAAFDLMLLSLGGSYEHAHHKFKSFGNLDARRKMLTLGLRLTFGGEGRLR